jgi:hypothetical protein
MNLEASQAASRDVLITFGLPEDLATFLIFNIYTVRIQSVKSEREIARKCEIRT